MYKSDGYFFQAPIQNIDNNVKKKFKIFIVFQVLYQVLQLFMKRESENLKRYNANLL